MQVQTTALNPRQLTRIGCVSYLNAKPLIYGVDTLEDVQLSLEVPAKLINGLRDRRFDVALLPIIDYQRLENVRVLTCGGIGCNGPTLTVRIFSRVPVDQIQLLHCDVHSHSSVALARVILAESYGLKPQFVHYDHSNPSAEIESILLIGDKVVCEEPFGYEYQIDLGEAWKKLTGLPFVFAAWVAHDDADIGDLSSQLNASKQQGMSHLPEIVAKDAIPRGWPPDLAMRYMTEFLKYDIGPKQLEAIRLFHQLAFRHGMIASVRQLIVD